MSDQIVHFIEKFNEAWTKGNIKELDSLLHDKVIFIAPDLKTEISGKEACLQTIKDYVDNANTKTFKLLDKKIHSWNQTAMISIEYHIEYDMGNRDHKEQGTEFWTLNKQQNNWKLIWRAMVKNEKVN